MVESLANYISQNADKTILKSMTSQQIMEILRCISDWVYRREVSKDYFSHVKNLDKPPEASTGPLDFMEELKKIK